MKYGDLTLGQIEALVNKLGGTQNVRDILSGKKHVTLMPIRDLQIWNTVSLPDGTERDLVIVSLEQLGLDYLYERVSPQEIYEKAISLGLQLFPEALATEIPYLYKDAQETLLGNGHICLVRCEKGVLRINLQLAVKVFPFKVGGADERIDAQASHNQKWLFVLPRP
jgi:hypothetical protein